MKPTIYLSVLLIAAAASTPSYASDDCNRIVGDAERLECYDALAGRERRAESPKATPSPGHWLARFGKRDRPERALPVVEARIRAIRKAPLGHHIMDLDNGQVWAENEAGKIQIDADQLVTITKKRFNYVMRLESGKRLAVHRVDT